MGQKRPVDLIDVRTWSRYVQRHVKGARSMPLRAVLGRGWRNMKILDEGIPGWIEKGYPTAGTEPAARIERHE